MTGARLVLEPGRRYADRRGRTWSCVALVPAAAGGTPVGVCREDLTGSTHIYWLDGAALATGARSWFDLVLEVAP